MRGTNVKKILTHFFCPEDGCKRLLGNIFRFMVGDTFNYYAENGNLCSHDLENLIKD